MKRPSSFSTGDPSYFVVASTSGNVSPTAFEAVQADLRARSHVVTASRGGVGRVALIGIDPKTKQATGAGPAAGKME